MKERIKLQRYSLTSASSCPDLVVALSASFPALYNHDNKVFILTSVNIDIEGPDCSQRIQNKVNHLALDKLPLLVPKSEGRKEHTVPPCRKNRHCIAPKQHPKYLSSYCLSKVGLHKGSLFTMQMLSGDQLQHRRVCSKLTICPNDCSYKITLSSSSAW